jgi:predicted secreted Zn-dependent protease
MPVFVTLIASALAQAQPPASATPLKRLSDVPGVAVTYYDVAGTTIPQLHDWLQKHGPKDAQTHKVTPATSAWSVGASAKWSKTGGQCTLTGATIQFTATVQLPRLAPGAQLPAAALSTWNAYVAALEGGQAERLAFVHDRLGEVERAILRSNCDNWQKAADAAITRLDQEQGQKFPTDPAKQPRLQDSESKT